MFKRNEHTTLLRGCTIGIPNRWVLFAVANSGGSSGPTLCSGALYLTQMNIFYVFVPAYIPRTSHRQIFSTFASTRAPSSIVVVYSRISFYAWWALAGKMAWRGGT